MSLFFSRQHDVAAGGVRAVQWNGENIEEVERFLENATLHGVEMFFPAEAVPSHRILIADLDFPFWLEKGEWLSLSRDGELDGWADSVFRQTFTLELAGAEA